MATRRTAPTDWLTPAEAAQYLRVAHSTIYRWAQRGLLTLYRVGEGATRIKRSEVATLAHPIGGQVLKRPNLGRRRATVRRLMGIRTKLSGRRIALTNRVIEGRRELEDHA